MLEERRMEHIRLRKMSYPDGWCSPTHAHKNARFVFVLKGSFSEKYGRFERFCSPLTFIFRPPHEEHSDDYHNNGVVCLSVDISSQWLDRLRQHHVGLVVSKQLRSANLDSLIVKLNEELMAGDNVSDRGLRMFLIESAIELHRSRPPVLASDAKWITRAEDFIRENMLAGLSLNMIATEVGVHPVHLARTFRRKNHCTVGEYVRRLRIETACLSLTSSAIPLAQIAAEVGFSDQSHFSRTFKRVTGMTPAQYRTIFQSRR